MYGQAFNGPTIAAGDAGDAFVIACVLVTEVIPSQRLVAVTEIFPDTNVVAKCTWIELVPWPEINVAFAGIVHTNDASVAAIEYVA